MIAKTKLQRKGKSQKIQRIRKLTCLQKTRIMKETSLLDKKIRSKQGA